MQEDLTRRAIDTDQARIKPQNRPAAEPNKFGWPLLFIFTGLATFVLVTQLW